MSTRQRRPRRTSDAKKQKVVLRIDSHVVEWWTDAARRTGTSRSALISVVLDIVANSLDVCEEPRAGQSVVSLGYQTAKGLVVQGLGGPRLRGDVIAYWERMLRAVRRRGWRPPKWAGPAETREEVIRRIEGHIAQIKMAADSAKVR